MKSTGHICVVDDDTAIASLLVELLTDEGYVVYSASNGASALSLLIPNPPALLLVDMRMPGMSGRELITRLRASHVDLPIVVMTAALDDAELFRTAGVECIAKPFDIETLLACVAHYVQPDETTRSLSSQARSEQEKTVGG